MKRYEVVILSDNPNLVSLVGEALETAGLDVNINYLFDSTPMYPVDATMFEVIDEDGRTGDALWGLLIEKEEEQ